MPNEQVSVADVVPLAQALLQLAQAPEPGPANPEPLLVKIFIRICQAL